MTEPTQPEADATPPQLVDVISPTGERTRIAAEDVPRATRPEKGYTVVPPEQLAREAAEEESAKGPYQRMRERGHGVVASGLTAALQYASGGTDQTQALREAGVEGASGGLVQAGVASALGEVDPKYRKAYVSELERLREAYPTTRTLGVIGGNLARDVALSAVGVPSIAGSVGEATGARLGGLAAQGALGRAAARGLAGAAGLGVESAVYGGTSEFSEEALGDQQLSAEKILTAAGKQGGLGFLFGGALGAGGSLLKSGTTALKEGASNLLTENAEKLSDAANEARWRSLGPIKKFTQEAEARFPGGKVGVGERLKKYGVTGNTLEDAARGGDPESILEKVEAAKQQVGQKLGEIYEGSKATVRAGDVLDAFDKHIAPLETSAFHKPIAKSLRDMQVDLAGHLGALDPDALARGQVVFRPDVEIPVQSVIKQRQFLQDLAFRESKALDPNMRVELLRSFRSDMTDIERGAIDKAAKEAGDTEAGAKLRELAIDYQAMSLAEKAVSSRVAALGSNLRFGLIDTLHSGTGAKIGATIGGLVGGAPGAALGGAAGGIVGGVGSHLVRQRGNAMLATVLDSVAEKAAIVKRMREADALVGDAAKGLAGTTKGTGMKYSAQPIAQRYADAVKRVAAVQAAHQAFTDHMQAMAIPSAPNISAAMAITASKQAQFLASQIPPSVNRPTIGTPEKQPRASISDMTRFMHVFDAVTDPQHVLTNLAAGKVNTHEVFALKNATPKLYEQLQQQALAEVAKAQANGKPLTHEQRLKLGIVLDVPTDPSLDPGTLKRLQASISSQGKKENAPDKGAPSRPVKLQIAEPSPLDRLDTR